MASELPTAPEATNDQIDFENAAIKDGTVYVC
jgi:hypothetical protein